MAIAVAASSGPGAMTPRDETIALAAPEFAFQQLDDSTGQRARVASWNEPCLIAL
jgi:hypothetical protein